MLPLQELMLNLSLIKKELVIPMQEGNKFFVVPEASVKNFLDQVLELSDVDMKFQNVKQSQPYSHSLDKATIVNYSNATVTQQETFTKTTTGIYIITFILFKLLLFVLYIFFFSPPSIFTTVISFRSLAYHFFLFMALCLFNVPFY